MPFITVNIYETNGWSSAGKVLDKDVLYMCTGSVVNSKDTIYGQVHFLKRVKVAVEDDSLILIPANAFFIQ